MAERIDWTKYLVPRTITNEIPELDSKTLNTTDFVTIPSKEEFYDKNNHRLFSIKKPTDFASGESRGLGNNGKYWLRNMLMRADGPEVDMATGVSKDIGLAPSISLKLQEGYTLKQLAQQLGLTKQKIGFGKGRYQVSLGEYPKSRVQPDSDLSQELFTRYTDKEEDDDFHCTGKLYSVATMQFVNLCSEVCLFDKHYPEFEYRGERYVYANHGKDNVCWYKVEPLTWWVRNFDEVASGKAKQIDLDCSEIIIGDIPFHTGWSADYAEMWQNSLVRAFLNSADSRQLDGNPDYRVAGSEWDFTQCGFLQQALNLTREPTRVYTIPAEGSVIGNHAFSGCRGLEKIFIPDDAVFGYEPFEGCEQTQFWFGVNQDVENLYGKFPVRPKYLYVPKTTDGKWLVFSPYADASLSQDYREIKLPTSFQRDVIDNFFNANYRQNFIQLHNWKENQQIKFIPPEFMLKLFPSGTMKNYFVNNNHKRWAELVKSVHFDCLNDSRKTNSLTDLMKIYYAIGGFSEYQGERDKAFDYVVQHIANLAHIAKKYEQFEIYNPVSEITLSTADMSAQQLADLVADEIHQRFSRLVLNGPHNPIFAKFLMKYYHDDPDFMAFFDSHGKAQDYLCTAHNSFDQILKNYPNRVVSGNTERNLLTPKFVAEHCNIVEYEDIDEGNQDLAATVGEYGYTQEQFDEIQKIYNQAKRHKDNYVIRADRSLEEKCFISRTAKRRPARVRDW